MLPSEEAVDSKKIPRKWILRKNIENGSEMLRIALPEDELIANFEKRRDTRNKMRVTFLNLKWTISFYEILFYFFKASLVLASAAAALIVPSIKIYASA